MCSPKTCPDRHKVEKNGDCTACDDYFKQDSPPYQCITDKCGPSQIKKIDGTCGPCPDPDT